MIVALLLIAAAPAVESFLPCTPGLKIEYTIESKNTGKVTRATETVLGPGKEARSCLIERVGSTASEKEILMREHLDDRVSNAGYADQPLALRPPLLKAPVQKGKSWHFTTTRFEIADVGDTYDVPAGTFEDCVRVHESAKDGKHEADSVYAPGVGLISYESRDLRMRATKVERTQTSPDMKDSKRTSK